jgi:DNA-binding SARP family transcriptional activator
VHYALVFVTIFFMVNLRLNLFGSPRLERDGRVVEMDTRKALALLAVVALSGQEHQREALVALFYPETDSVSARAAFRRTLSTLHNALGEGILSIQREAVELAPQASLWVDVLHFRALAKKLDDPVSLEQAAALYRGDFMAGFSLRDSPAFDDWQYQQTEELRRLLDRALDKLASSQAAQGNYPAAIQAAERRVKLDPLVEEAHRQLMELYARAEQRSAALRQYRKCARILQEELGVSPLEETTRLYQQVLNGKLGRTLPAVAERPSLPPPHVRLGEVRPLPLVGRAHEIAALAQVLSKSPSKGMFIAVEGEAGVGKTRLAEEFIAEARYARRTIAQARCYEGQTGLAYAPFMEGLGALLADGSYIARLATLSPAITAEVASLFPELPLSTREAKPPLLTEGVTAQARFFEALRQMTSCLLGGDLPGVIFLDDLHWADSGTLDLLTYLARRVQPTGCIILAAWRSEQGPVSERLNQLVAELQRAECALHLPLGRLNPAEINQLATSRGASLPAGLVERLYQESEGLPFIALEYLLSLEQPGAEWKIPGGVRALLHRRLQAPSEPARQLLAAAAVIGRSFDFSTLQAISGRSEWETVEGVEELVRLGLVCEQDGGGYDFSHDKLRALAYEETSTARRRLLHRRAGEILVNATPGTRDAGPKASLAAGHFLGAGQLARAAEYFRQAGDYARHLHANGEALEAYQSALAAGHPDPAGLHEACGDLFTLRGEYRAAVASYQAAAALCTPGCFSHLMHKLGEVHHRRGDWEAAEGHYRAALEAAGVASEPAWQAHLLADWSLTAYRSAQAGQAEALAEKALEMAQEGKNPAAQAQALNMLGILARARGELQQAGAHFEHSLESANGLDNLALRGAVLHNLARLEQERGRPAEAIPLTQQALEYCVLLGDRHHQAALLNTLADLHHAAGREAEAMIHLKQAVTLFAEIGEETGWDQPEIWKLTEW